MGRDDREEEQGAGGERGRRREEEADRGRIDRTLPHLYTIYSPFPPHSVFVRLVPHAARVAKNVMLCYVMGSLYYSKKGVLGDDS